MTRRLIVGSLTLVFLAANLIVVKRLARNGRIVGAFSGMVGVGIAFAIPSILAIMFGMGEGIAFLSVLGATVVGAALCGGIGGACMTPRYCEDQKANYNSGGDRSGNGA